MHIRVSVGSPSVAIEIEFEGHAATQVPHRTHRSASITAAAVLWNQILFMGSSNPASAAYYGSGSCGAIYEGAIGTGSFIWPTVSTVLSGYDFRPGFHNGIDIAGPEGNSVWAVDSGVVVYAGWSEYGFGNLIVLDHGNGWQSAYAHLSVVGVICGQSVALGTTIGNVGNTGNSTGPHLHFELRSELFGKVNPWDYISP